MPINLTQEFTFETDLIDSFATVLRAVVPVLFGADCQVRAADKGDDEWPSETAAWFLLQNAGSDERPSAAGTWFTSRFGNLFRRRNENPGSLHWPICALSSTTSSNEDRARLTVEDAVTETVRRVQGADVGELERNCGGRRGPFGRADGGVHPGYRMHWSTQHGEWLIISLCHIYYPK
jgi:hypothetical protein